MILSSMTYKEMFTAIKEDMHKLKIRIDKTYPKAIRFFKHAKSFPTWFIDDYTIPSTNNQYIIFFYAGNIGEIEKPHYKTFSVLFCENQRYVIQGMRMGYQHTPKCETIMLPQIHAYTSHFFQRYNERCLLNFNRENLSPNEIAGLFFVRNPGPPIPIMLNDEVNRNYKKYGDYNDRGMRVNDGFCFTQTTIDGNPSSDGIREHDKVDAMLIIYTTFMCESDMSETQITAINKEHIETYKRCMEALLKTCEKSI